MESRVRIVPQVSVVMPVYNGEKYLAEAIESILAQTFTDFEFIIVDDGSTDGSAGIARDYARRDGRLHLLQHDGNLGGPFARNSGIAAANGTFIATMDCDDVSLPQRLERQVAYLEANPGIGLLGSRARIMGAAMEPLGVTDQPVEHALIALNIFIGGFFTHSTTTFRRRYLEAVGGYNPKWRNAEDLELYSRLLAETDIRIANLPETLLLYRVHEDSKSHRQDGKTRMFGLEARLDALERLGLERSEAIVHRLENLQWYLSLTWAERRQAKRNLRRIINGMVAQEWVKPGDRPLLIHEMNRRLEQVSPRRWQMFCHWYRHRIRRNLA